jgi:hypothetical protein
MASGKRFNITTPTPSPGTNPFARVSKVKHLPFWDNILDLLVNICMEGPTATNTPPANAKSDVCNTKLSQAAAIATKEEEQAVSMDKQGPVKFNKYEIRAPRIEVDPPIRSMASNAVLSDDLP